MALDAELQTDAACVNSRSDRPFLPATFRRARQAVIEVLRYESI
jgi:hypothetical protein